LFCGWFGLKNVSEITNNTEIVKLEPEMIKMSMTVSSSLFIFTGFIIVGLLIVIWQIKKGTHDVEE